MKKHNNLDFIDALWWSLIDSHSIFDPNVNISKTFKIGKIFKASVTCQKY